MFHVEHSSNLDGFPTSCHLLMKNIGLLKPNTGLDSTNYYPDSWLSRFITPINRMRLVDCGTGMGSSHPTHGFEAMAILSCSSPISSANLPPGFANLIATGKMSLNCSTARKVTTSPLRENAWAGLAKTSTFSNFMARTTSRRKVAFL